MANPIHLPALSTEIQCHSAPYLATNGSDARRVAKRRRALRTQRLAAERRLRYKTPMRAVIFEQPGDESVLHLGEAPDPTLGPNDLRIGVRATAVNRADLLQRQGMYPSPPGASPILGLECAGEVVE